MLSILSLSLHAWLSQGELPFIRHGYGYVLSPVLLSAVVLLAVAVAFNYPFSWRRYPQAWWRQTVACESPQANAAGSEEKCMIPHSDLVYALSQIDTFVDVSEEDLQKIYALALGREHDTTEVVEMPASAQPAEAFR